MDNDLSSEELMDVAIQLIKEQLESDPHYYDSCLIEDAKKGDQEAGLDLLRSLMSKIYSNQYDSPVFPYFAQCLRDFLDNGVKLERAFNIEKDEKRGRKKEDLANRDIDLARQAYYLIPQLRKSGVTSPTDTAFEKVATKNNIRKTLVKNAYYSMKKYLNWRESLKNNSL